MAESTAAEILLEEFRAFRYTEFREFRDAIHEQLAGHGERLAVAENEIKAGLTGNHTPSRLSVVEDIVAGLQKFKWSTIGRVSAIGAVVGSGLTFVANVVYHYVTGTKH